jgi:hypothetical protein
MTLHDAEAADNAADRENAGEHKGPRYGDEDRSAPASVIHGGSNLRHNLFCWGLPSQRATQLMTSYAIVAWRRHDLWDAETPPDIGCPNGGCVPSHWLDLGNDHL